MNKLSCGPKNRISEVEVDIVCTYYGLPEEVSKYIQLLAFSKHLPFTMPTGIYTNYPTAMYPLRSIWKAGNAQRYACDMEYGRIESIRNAIKSIGGVTTGGVYDIDNFDKELPVGRLRNEVRNYILTVDGICRQKQSIVDHRKRIQGSMYHRVALLNLIPEQRPYKRITRNTWK